MSEVVRFKSEHLFSILDQPINVALKDFFLSGVAKEMEKTESFSYFYGGAVMVCGGITDYWPGRGQLWAMFNEESRYNFVPTFRAIKHWLSFQLKNNYRRIELSVDDGFEVGKRRAELLGFTLECPLAKNYLPSGGDCSLYSFVRGD